MKSVVLVLVFCFVLVLCSFFGLVVRFVVFLLLLLLFAFLFGLQMYVYLLYIKNKLKSQLDGMMQNSFIQRYISFLVAICYILCHKLTLCHINE